MDVHFTGLDATQVLWLTNLLSTGSHRLRTRGQEYDSIEPGSVLGSILTDTAAFGEAIAQQLVEQSRPEGRPAPEQLVVNLNPKPTNVVRVKFG
ncbi:hypothetical protein [Azospirillum sp. SYSU D00513]|uniref:hypothetical protein n=1 Tax=Azospirillum sp. SYSU D00513 TaxID=2812561 RepID=UPI001A960918|nr:hypothetical protein [Azospirillum sp. SYSU D00513]